MAAPARQRADAEIQNPPPHRRAIIGSPSNFWLHSTRDGFDLSHPPTPDSAPISPSLRLQTTTTPITIDPQKSALVIIDMQNFFLSEALGRAANGPGHKACDALLKHAIPAARKAGIQVIWLNWGLMDKDISTMPPATLRAFGFESVPASNPSSPNLPPTEKNPTPDSNIKNEGADEITRLPSTTTENGKPKHIYKGLGSDMGPITLPDGTTVPGGHLLMRSTWNAALYPPLHTAYEEGLHPDSPYQKPDIWIHKNRMSGLWGPRTPCTEYLEAHGLRTLLFAG
ncbi:MAG: hypothetical protein M1830_005767, partial [Pleopsidium flavum]